MRGKEYMKNSIERKRQVKKPMKFMLKVLKDVLRKMEGGAKMKTRSKYGANKIVVDGITFDSKDEAKYYLYLKKRKAEGKILNFELQPKFTIIPAFKYKDKTERAATYSLDFLVYHLDNTEEYIDVKSMGTATQQGELKFKLLKYLHPELNFKWVCRNLKHGDENGWIEYKELKKKLAKQKIEKGE